jgi:hypothetical protein
MSYYVQLSLDTNALWQAAFRSAGNGALIGAGGTSTPTKFWLTMGPRGTNYNAIETDSDLKNAVDDWYSQRGSAKVCCVNLSGYSSNGMSIIDETPRPLPDGTIDTFFVSANPVISFDQITIIENGNEYELPEGGYTYELQQVDGVYTGTFTVDPIPSRSALIYVDYTMDALTGALRDIMTEDVQFVILANETGLDNLQTLRRHVDLAFSCGRYRMGVAMLPQNQRLTGTYRNYPQQLASENMILLGHTTTNDMAACYAGALSGIRVFDDPILMSVNASYDNRFDDNDRLSFQAAKVNCIDNYYSHELGLRGLRNFTLSPTSDRQFVDFVRTYQDLMWRLISTLDSPNVIGKIPFNRTGMAKLRSKIHEAFLIPRQIGEIDQLTGITIALEQIINKSFSSRTEEEQGVLNAAKANRKLGDISVGFIYPGYVNDLDLKLKVV